MYKMFSVAIAGTLLQTAQASTQIDAKDSISQKGYGDTAPAVKQTNILKDVVTKAKVSGFGFARFLTINGFDNIGQNGQSQQYRIKLDVTSGQVYGFSATAGIFFSQGSSTPDVGNNTDGAVQGGRSTAFTNNFSDRFNISQLFASKEFNIDEINAKIDVGKINISSPLSDNKVDLGTGIVANVKHSVDSLGDFKYYASFYDSWSGDQMGYNIRYRSPMNGNTALTDQNAAGIGIGNNLTLLGSSGKMMDKALNFSVYAGNIYGFMDFLFYGEAKYVMNLSPMNLTFLAQTSMASLSNNPHLDLGFNGKSITSNFDTELQSAAKFRGLYNLQAKLSYNKMSLKAGYLGSFGDGYGTLIDYKGSMDTAGKIWNGNMTATYEGLGMLGSGSFKNSSINVVYVAAEYGFKIPLKIGLDIAYVFGNTNTPVLKVSPHGSSINHASIGQQQFIWQANFAEITPQISYKCFDGLELSVMAGTLVGDINFFKTKTELKYTF